MSGILFIIGMSGAGKTKWGREVAKSFGLPFFDIDSHIETGHKKTVTRFFTDHGEPFFREVESKALRDIVKNNRPPFVVSCGGGTPVDPSNLAFMKAHGCTVYLRASIPTLIANLKEDIVQRPMLTNGIVSPVVQLTRLYEKRQAVYEQADFILDTEHVSIQDFEPILHACTRQH